MITRERETDRRAARNRAALRGRGLSSKEIGSKGYRRVVVYVGINGLPRHFAQVLLRNRIPQPIKGPRIAGHLPRAQQRSVRQPDRPREGYQAMNRALSRNDLCKSILGIALRIDGDCFDKSVIVFFGSLIVSGKAHSLHFTIYIETIPL